VVQAAAVVVEVVLHTEALLVQQEQQDKDLLVEMDSLPLAFIMEAVAVALEQLV
jgi:hypothetical protein